MIQVAIMGYGNLGKSVLHALHDTSDMTVQAVYSRRAPSEGDRLPDGTPLLPAAAIEKAAKKPDVVINCGGSAEDLPRTTPALAKRFCVVDSFDTHDNIPAHAAAINAIAGAAGTLCIISAGWDPGLFSLMRLFGFAFLPAAGVGTFWGPGVSQGHSDALRQISGVADARQYTVPMPEAMADARAGRKVSSTAAHKRVCYIVPQPNADLAAIERRVRAMPGYFAGYEVEIHFISMQELQAQHSRLPHGGSVICSGETPEGRQTMELKLRLASNPIFTAGILVACARAAVQMHRAGQSGCRTMLEVPPIAYAPLPPDTLIQQYM